jgi:hypothetical protein
MSTHRLLKSVPIARQATHGTKLTPTLPRLSVSRVGIESKGSAVYVELSIRQIYVNEGAEMRVIIPRNKTPRKESSRERQQRALNEQRLIERQAAMIDVHDLLHSIFWGKPTRDEMREVWDRLSAHTETQKVNLMQSEIDELVDQGLTHVPKGEKHGTPDR